MKRSQIDENTFETILNQYGEDTKRFILTYVKDPSVTDDLVQEVFMKVYLKLDTFDDRSTLKTWIFRIAMNTCKDYFKSWNYRKVKVKVMQSFELDKSKTGENPEEQMMQRFQHNVILREILSLNPKFREVILLHYYQDFSLKEIASILDLNPSTVRSRMLRAREKLKNKLGGEHFESENQEND